jgi:hypothetical protein
LAWAAIACSLKVQMLVLVKVFSTAPVVTFLQVQVWDAVETVSQ